jgi:hypothetical protein
MELLEQYDVDGYVEGCSGILILLLHGMQLFAYLRLSGIPLDHVNDYRTGTAEIARGEWLCRKLRSLL